MFVFANSLAFNGGSTFLIRLAREFQRRNAKIGILVLTNNIDKGLLCQLNDVADVYFLRDFCRGAIFRFLSANQSGLFLPLNFQKLGAIVRSYGCHIHVMGVFGLLFAARFSRRHKSPVFVSAGVFHQYEYMFSSDTYLAQYSKRLFQRLGSDGVVFFNDANVTSYSKHFGLDYNASTLVPIGIEVPTRSEPLGDFDSKRIVSIGNLYGFKTYNVHIVMLMPELLKIDPSFCYEIYGEGELESEVKRLILEYGLEKNVRLMGRIPYTQFTNVLKGAFLFVGSGTAIVEAAALGIPSLVGIESSKDPVTYGFICDVDGYSYNEFNERQNLINMISVVKQIASDRSAWLDISAKCLSKAQEFSIARTVDGYELLDAINVDNVDRPSRFEIFRCFLSFIYLSFKHVCGIDRSFANRRSGAL